MRRFFGSKFREKGNVLVGAVISLAIVILIVAGIIPTLQSIGTNTAIGKLTGEGYVVLAAGDYTTLLNAVNANGTAIGVASAAATAANNAAVVASNTGQVVLTTLLLHNENVTYLYPDSTLTTDNVTFVAGAPADNYGGWLTVTDGISPLSTVIGANDSYLVEITTRNYSRADELYIIELGYDGGATIIGRVKVRSDWTYVMTLGSAVIPSGKILQYRMKAQTAGATLLADFRYYLKP